MTISGRERKVLEAVNLHLFLARKADLDHEVHNVVALVTLKLDHLAVFRMEHHRAIASELLQQSGNGQRI